MVSKAKLRISPSAKANGCSLCASIQRCLRDGDKLVLVTEEGKIYQIANQDKLTEETYGQVVTLIGKTEGETITVDSVKL